MLNILILFVVFHLFHGLATCNLFQKAGRKPWEAFVPIYNLIIGLKIMERPRWWVILLNIPIIMVVMWAVYWIDLARAYGKRDIPTAILIIITGGLYMLYLNWVAKPNYEGAEERKTTFVSSLAFAVVLATFVHVWLVRPMVIPTGSMENTLLVGDALFVEKLSYGTRVPITPISVPFSELFARNAYSEKIQMPYMRFPGWRDLQKNDIVVFNYPADSLFGPIDRRDPYVKRLVGLPSDTIQIVDGVLYNNGQEFQPKADAVMQFSCNVESQTPISPKFLEQELGLFKEPSKMGGKDYFNSTDFKTFFFTGLNEEQINTLQKIKGIKIEKAIDSTKKREPNIFPRNPAWNKDNYGPLYIPKKGDKIKLTLENLPTYQLLIQRHEGNTLELKDNQIYINGKAANEYTFKQDYFWMMGDNRHNSHDARYFGFVPEDHIIGRPWVLWANLNNLLGFEGKRDLFDLKKWRFDRWFTTPNNGNPNKKSYGLYVLIFLVLYIGWDIWRGMKRKKSDEA